ncbi:MAG: hypothetical protein ACW99X_00860 [Candidatus Thorarchaeota archaeon]|jgi:hypothetical protein
MRHKQLVLEFTSSTPDYSGITLQETLTESLWTTAKDEELHILLREPALLELARRQEPGVLSLCDRLLVSEDQERWFSALKILGALNTYDAIQRLLVVCGYSGTGDRGVVMHVLARVLTPAHREGFRRILRSMVSPGVLDVSGWSPTALSVLKAVCTEKSIDVETSFLSLSRSFKENENVPTTSVQVQHHAKRK